jgi:hypothetical protein
MLLSVCLRSDIDLILLSACLSYFSDVEAFYTQFFKSAHCLKKNIKLTSATIVYFRSIITGTVLSVIFV